MNSAVQLGKDEESLRRLGEIDKSVAFVETLLNKYTWEATEISNITADLDFIYRKRNDKYLNLSIIGEFSSGKSTFINALLRDNLLESANLQGTTTANTVIRYAPDYDIIIKYKDGTTKTFSGKKVGYRGGTTETFSEEKVGQRAGNNRSFFGLLFGCFGLFGFIYRLFASLFRRKNTLQEPKEQIEEPTASQSEKNEKETLQKLKEWIKELTTNQRENTLIGEIIIEHPAQILKGITIIDTPGINSLERWHEEVTKTAIREISDVSVILTTADKPMPETLNKFIEENLSDVLERCIFVATKMDVVREKERKSQIAYIRQKISEAFKLPDPVVLPHTPMFVLGEADPEYRAATYTYERDDYHRLIEESNATEQAIRQKLIQQRIAIQVQKLSRVMSRTLSNLSSSINVRQTEFKERYAILEKHQKPDFVEFINNMAEKYLAKLNKEYEKHCEEMWKMLNSLCDSQSQSIANEFFGLSDKNSLEPFCEKKMPKILTANATILVRESHNYFPRLSNIATGILEAFWVEFSKIYSELTTLNVKATNIKFSIDKRQIGNVSFDNNTLNQSFQKFDFKDNLVTFGGAGVGATIGTFIFPGIGTAIGGVIGAVIGSIFGPSLDKLKGDIWNQIAPNIDQYYQNISDYISNDIHQQYEKLFDHVVSQLDDCFNVYHELIASMRQQNEEERNKLERYIAMTKTDSSEIQNKLAFFGVKASPTIHDSKKAQSPSMQFPLPNTCSSCNSTIEADDSFCPNCGQAARSVSQPA